jgi:hypothetical protein
MGLFDAFKDRKPSKPRDKRSVAERAAEEVTRAKLSQARDVLADAEDEAGKQKNARVKVAMVKEARAELALGNEQKAIGLVQQALGKGWARKVRTALTARQQRKRNGNGKAPAEGAAKPADQKVA